jgi:CubicO group peptidase (beta-lactamase class C family)
VILPLVTLLSALSLGDSVPVRAPRTVGMASERLAEVDRIVQRGITAGAYPGASVVIGRRGAVIWQKGYGRLAWPRTAAAVNPTTSIYDLASLTKAVCLTTAAMMLYDAGMLPLETRVQTILPEFTGRWKERVTVAHLLTHRSGLPPGRRIWQTARNPAEARQQVLTTRLNSIPGGVTDYSDLGAMVLGFTIERVSGMPLDEFCETKVFAPLGMRNTFYTPDSALRSRIAPTEMYPPRGYSLRGEVHDESAYAIGKVSGNAGLFSTAPDLAIFAQMMLNRGTYGGVRLIADSTVRRFTTLQANKRTFGWMIASGEQGSGEYLSATTYGHAGYTGTSLWIDPERQLFVIILTNRVHDPRARRPGIIMADVRHDVADAAALAITDDNTLRTVSWPREFRVDQRPDWNPPTRERVRRPTTLPRNAPASSPTSDIKQ